MFRSNEDAHVNPLSLSSMSCILGLEKEYPFAVSFEEELKENISKGRAYFDEILTAMSLFVKSI